MYKVFFKDRTLFFTNHVDNDLAIHANTIYKYDTPNQLQVFITDFLNKKHLKTGVIYSHNQEKAFEAFKSCFIYIQAAGGVVFNDRHEFIGIHKKGKNDLPKGKLKKGENPETAAVREVKEECGIKTVKLLHRIIVTYHIYHIDDKPVLKQTHWFNMFTESETLTAQQEEGISNIFWIPANHTQQFLSNTYSSLKDVIDAAGLSSGKY